MRQRVTLVMDFHALDIILPEEVMALPCSELDGCCTLETCKGNARQANLIMNCGCWVAHECLMIAMSKKGWEL